MCRSSKYLFHSFIALSIARYDCEVVPIVIITNSRSICHHWSVFALQEPFDDLRARRASRFLWCKWCKRLKIDKSTRPSSTKVANGSSSAETRRNEEVYNQYVLPVMTYGIDTWLRSIGFIYKLKVSKRTIEKPIHGVSL